MTQVSFEGKVTQLNSKFGCKRVNKTGMNFSSISGDAETLMCALSPLLSSNCKQEPSNGSLHSKFKEKFFQISPKKRKILDTEMCIPIRVGKGTLGFSNYGEKNTLHKVMRIEGLEVVRIHISVRCSIFITFPLNSIQDTLLPDLLFPHLFRSR